MTHLEQLVVLRHETAEIKDRIINDEEDIQGAFIRLCDTISKFIELVISKEDAQ